MKSHLLVISFPLLILSSTFLIKPSEIPAQTALTPMPEIEIPYTLGYSIESGDARPIIISNYLKEYKSPLQPYSNLIVEISDKYQLDYRLLVAIARQESALCHKIPENSFNCWGFGIYGDKVTRFDSYEEGLEIVAKTLKHKYIDYGLVSAEEIMAKYTPPSVLIGGPWAKGVNEFLTDLE